MHHAASPTYPGAVAGCSAMARETDSSGREQRRKQRKESGQRREERKKRVRAVLDAIPGGRDGLRELRADPPGAAHRHEDLLYQGVLLSHCQALLDMPGSQEERALRVTDYLIYHGVLDEPAANVPEWRGHRFIHLRNYGFDKLEAIWEIARQEGLGTTAEAVLQSLREFKRSGAFMCGWSGQNFSDLPGLSSGKLREPDAKTGLGPEDSEEALEAPLDLASDIAKAAIDDLCRDPEFMDRYLSGHRQVFALMTRLHQLAFPEDVPSD